ncbi:ImmA/IrrE family metallo-endopeptidase [Scytonema millei]|uniref:ImmA/IrrE family metallo-endopeptidase n=1 Tax=Scytonema millei VB511283 TaxID=1245923 RepID=A0A9X5E1X3_9CYAN|nr:ImmA/IrrE family metallo-endopeptidase [Scytonema millei]NHC33652.1 ImmA/IrrE family metallo-endopeptidase [Scytonema millei VB511283]
MKVIKPYQSISKKEIEHRALDVLQRVQAKRKRPLKFPLDAGHMAESLGLDMDCGEIAPDEQGAIAAMILPTERKIIMNESSLNLPKGFEESSIAHEIGHWELHIDKNAISKFVELQDSGVETAVEPFLCRSVNAQQGIEKQAQYFASCLLMPQFKIEDVKRGRDLTKWKHLYAMKDELGVTISNLTHRLQDLGLIYIPKDSKQIYLGKAGS